MRRDGLVVCFFMDKAQRTLCRLSVDQVREVGRWWVSDPATAAKDVSCPDCLAERARRVTAKG